MWVAFYIQRYPNSQMNPRKKLLQLFKPLATDASMNLVDFLWEKENERIRKKWPS